MNLGQVKQFLNTWYISLIALLAFIVFNSLMMYSYQQSSKNIGTIIQSLEKLKNIEVYEVEELINALNVLSDSLKNIDASSSMFFEQPEISKQVIKTAYEGLIKQHLLSLIEAEGRIIVDNSANNYLRFQNLKNYKMLKALDKRASPSFNNWLTNLVSTSSSLNLYKLGISNHLDYALKESIDVDKLNSTFVARTESYLASRSKIELFYYEFIQSYKNAPGNIFDMEQIAGKDWKNVFIEPDEAFQNVSRIYMPELFETLSSHAMKEFVSELVAQQWVLGDNYVIDESELTIEMMRMYEYEYISTWRGFLANAKVSKAGSLDSLKEQIDAFAQSESPIFKLIGVAAQSTDLMDDTQKEALQEQFDKFNVSSIDEMAEFTTVKNNPQTKIASSFAPLHELIKEGRLESLKVELETKFVALKEALDSAKLENWEQINEITNEIETLAKEKPRPFKDWLTQVVSNIDTTFTNVHSSRLNRLWKPVYEQCNELTYNRYPFYGRARQDVSADAISKLFSKRGLIPEFRRKHLNAYLNSTRRGLRWKPIFRKRTQAANRSIAFFQQTQYLTEQLFRYDDSSAQMNLVFYPWKISRNSRRFELISGSKKLFYQYGTPHEEIISWPIHTDESGSSLVFTNRDKSISTIEKPGELSILRVIQDGRFEKYEDKTKLILSDGTHTMEYLFKTEKGEDPFVFEKVRNATCPKTIM